MKQVVFMAVFLSLFLSGLAVDAKWIPENASPEDIERLIKMEKEDKARIIKDQYRQEKAEQKQEQATGAAPAGVVGVAGSDRESLKQAGSVKSGEIQQESAQGMSGVAEKGEKTSSVDQGAEEAVGVEKAESPVGGVAAGSEKPLVLKKTGWQDWITIGLFLFISIICLIFYFYSMNRTNGKICGERGAGVKGTASKGLTLVEILIATAIIAISVLCILSVFRHASLVQPQTGYATKALTLCQEKIEEIRNRPYGSLTTMINPEVEKLTMGPYGWNGTVAVNGGAKRTVTIKRINEVWAESGPPRFEEVTSGNYTYLKANVKMEWGNISIPNGSVSIPYKRQLSVFIAPRP